MTTMSDSEIANLIEEMEDFKVYLQNNPEEAKKFMVETGVYNEDGSLTESYK